MNYSALIENRRSVREFTDKQVPFSVLNDLKNYYRTGVRRLIPKLKTKLFFFGTDAREALEGAAGYHSFLIGAPQYLVLLSEAHDQAALNAGFIMEDLVLQLTDMGLDSCWLTFTDSQDVKAALGIENDLDVVAIAATCPTPLGAVLKKELQGIPFVQQVCQMVSTHSADLKSKYTETVQQSQDILKHLLVL